VERLADEVHRFGQIIVKLAAADPPPWTISSIHLAARRMLSFVYAAA
jgi:hypothetical protein